MKKLRTEVIALVDKELAWANERFPMFNSDHEGISVIREEGLEAKADLESLRNLIDRLETQVFTDGLLDAKNDTAVNAEREAVELACEAIQTAAMLRKFRISHEEAEEFTQEEAEKLAIETPEANEKTYSDFANFIATLMLRRQGKENEDA